jgi:prepilin-type N-terminal cleavage/methylation domain-containing protein
MYRPNLHRVTPAIPVGRRGWTLIEMVAVLAIIAILSLVLVPVLLQEVDRLTRKDEENRLASIARGFQSSMLRNRTIASATNWASVVGTELGWRTEAVMTNGRGIARVFLIDPLLRIGPATNSVLPFTQDVSGSRAPTSPRLMIISSIGEALPTNIVTGVASSTNAFQAIWDAATDVIPSGWTWSGRPTDLRVQRIFLTPMFTTVSLNNVDTLAGKYGVDTGTTNTMTAGNSTFSTWYIRGTALRLHGNDNALQSAEVVQTPVSYVYEKGIWRGRAFMSLGTKRFNGQDLQDVADFFLSSPWNSNAKNSAKQSNVVAALTGYMQAYLTWQAGGFSYANSDLKPVGDAQVVVQNVTSDLIFKP